MELTPAQKLAVSVRGRGLLLSAAAGSGKTRVLVERLLRYVDDGADVDEFLVITYTRAAAAELRSRILEELNGRIAADPGSRRLRRQTELCCRACIGTIDSICGRLLREYVHLTALPPDFRVADQERAERMKRAALEAVLEDVYAHIDERPDFRTLIDSVGAGRDDRLLSSLVLKLHESLSAQPDVEAWMESCRATLNVQGVTDIGETVWGRELLKNTARRLHFWADRLEEAIAELALPEHEKLNRSYGGNFIELAASVRNAERACALSWKAAAAAFPITSPRIPGFRGEDERKEAIGNVRKDALEACKKLALIFADDQARLLAELSSTGGVMSALLELCSELEKRYAAEKRRQGLVDFSDQEHMVLRLLSDPSAGVAEELSARWREVMVDEYQDVNECQEKLFYALSGEGRRLFCVGDVKQSIYRFRLADPGIFLRKYKEFKPVREGEESDENDENGLILLRENFRSGAGVIRAANAVFGSLMSEELGEVKYDESAQLVQGRVIENEKPFTAQMLLLDVPEAGDDGERPEKTALEADMVAAEIRRLAESGTVIRENDGERPMRWSDVAILLRSAKRTAPVYRAALTRAGIPCAAAQTGGFFRSLEVTVLLSLLAVIDNPRQDIPLIAVLRSPLYGFTPDELAAIRTAAPGADFYTALTEAAKENERAAAFLSELEEYRCLAPDRSVEELLEHLCARCELYALLAALPDGELRRENLQTLFGYARQFESSGYRGLFSFVSWMHRLAERNEEPAGAPAEVGNAVQILSIHRSKGLQYPVVFLCDTARKFNMADTRGKVLLHPELGLGAKVVDAAAGVEYPSVAWRAIAARIRRECLSEELRVLYVALTRSQERLYVTAAWPKAGERVGKISGGLTDPPAPELLEDDESFAVWLCRCALLHPQELSLELRVPETVEDAEAAEQKAAGETASLELRERLGWRYPYAGSENLPSKLAASAWKPGELPDGDAAVPAVTAVPPAPRMPELSGDKGRLTPTERGVAVHLALQFIDFHCVGSAEAVRSELIRLTREGHLTARQAESVDPVSIAAFFASELGQRILHADAVRREQRFTLLVPAGELAEGAAEDEILLQGVVDCCIEEAGELTIIDYKTDFVTAETVGERAEGYRAQLLSYRRAMERITGKPVRECVLYFLRAGISVTV